MLVYDSSIDEMLVPTARDCEWIGDRFLANLDMWGAYLPPSPDVYFGLIYLLMEAGI